MPSLLKAIIVAAAIATVAVTAHAKDCRQWGGFGVKAAEHRNGGLTQAAAEQEVYEDALATPNAPADDMNRALLIVRSVYGTHPTPAEAGIAATATPECLIASVCPSWPLACAIVPRSRTDG